MQSGNPWVLQSVGHRTPKEFHSSGRKAQFARFDARMQVQPLRDLRGWGTD